MTGRQFFFGLAGRLAKALRRGCDRCPACAGLLPAGTEAAIVCRACALRLAPRTGGYCPKCGALFDSPDAPPLLCPQCRLQGRPWDGFAFYAPYDDLLRELILGLKFHGRLGQGRLLAAFVAEAWQRAAGRTDEGAMDPAGPDMLVPVPLHPKRLAWRGFNQSVELSRCLADRLHRPIVPAALVRIRNTTPQSSLSGPARRDNIQGAFAGDPEKVAGKQVLLVDDVMTTGATVETAVRALRQAGAVRVDVVVAAR